MFGKIIAVLAVVASVASAQSCGICGGFFRSSGICGSGGLSQSRVLNVGVVVPVASAAETCAPIAVPTQIVEGTTTPVAAVVAPVLSTGVVSTSGLYRSGVCSGCGYGSTFNDYGCGSGVVSTVY